MTDQSQMAGVMEAIEAIADAFTATRKGTSVNYVIPNNVENLQG